MRPGQRTEPRRYFGELIRKNAEGALALYGVSALPDDSASTLFMDAEQEERSYDFTGSQLGGVGGSVALAYGRRWPSDRELDVQLRYSYLRMRPIAGDKNIIAEADAESTALWARYR